MERRFGRIPGASSPSLNNGITNSTSPVKSTKLTVVPEISQHTRYRRNTGRHLNNGVSVNMVQKFGFAIFLIPDFSLADMSLQSRQA